MEEFEILFVDDEVEILDTVGQYLSQEGFNVTLSDNGLKALGLVKEDKRFDVVFTDLKMPEFDGLELLAAIKEHRPETEVIIVTGYGTIESAIEALKLGSYDYLQKPIKFERLKLLIDRIVEKKSLQNENILIKRRLKERYRYDELVGVIEKLGPDVELAPKKAYVSLRRKKQFGPARVHKCYVSGRRWILWLGRKAAV